jgi:hypothetical protein
VRPGILGGDGGDQFRGIDRIDLAGAGIELKCEAIAFARGQRQSLNRRGGSKRFRFCQCLGTKLFSLSKNVASLTSKMAYFQSLYIDDELIEHLTT